MASKVLVVGAIQGQIEKAFQKISKLHSKQNFSFAIVVGDLFAAESTESTTSNVKALLEGSINIPLPTYFTVGDSSLPEAVHESIEASGEVCTNLFYLGRKGTLKITEGVRIVNVGGRLVQNEASLTQALSNYDPLYLEVDANTLRGVNSADILITNQWPSRINLNSSTPLPENVDPESSSESLARLCTALKPRYHFSSAPTATAKWEREPFLHPQSYEESEQNTSVTRFVGLSSIAGSTKDWMYAFSLDLSKPPSTDGAQTLSPLTFSPKRKRMRDHDDPNDTAAANSFSRFDHSSSSRPYHGGGRKNNKRARYDPNDCFMCMSQPTFNTGMVVSISDESFVTVLKGPLPVPPGSTDPKQPATFPQLTFSGHSMVIPMFHAASETATSQRSPADLTTEYADMTRYRHSLNTMVASRSTTNRLGAVTWEVNRTGIRHLHWQHLATPPDLSPSLITAAYTLAGSKAQYPSFQPCDPDALLPPPHRADFFRLWIFHPSAANDDPVAAADATASGNDHAAGAETSMFFPIPADLKFNIAFGREVMAGLLRLEHRADWRGVPPGGEEQDAEAMKSDFAPFDAAMQ